jgi:hypothetical protein
MKRALTALAAILAVGATLIAGAAVPTGAQASTVSVYAVHGIPQSLFDVLGAPTTDVDVYAVPTGAGGLDSASPAVTFAFGDTAGPLEVPEGAYDVFVYPAGATPAADGSDAVLDLTTPDLPAGASAVIVAQLNEAGDGGALTPFVLDTSPTASGQARVQAFHTAAAPEVDVELADGTPVFAGLVNAVTDPAAATQDPVEVPAGTYGLQVATPDDSLVVPLGDFDLAAGSAYFAFAVGGVTDQSVQVVPLAIVVGEDAAAPTPAAPAPAPVEAAPHFTG